MLLSDKVDVRAERITRVREGHYIIKKGWSPKKSHNPITHTPGDGAANTGPEAARLKGDRESRSCRPTLSTLSPQLIEKLDGQSVRMTSGPQWTFTGHFTQRQQDLHSLQGSTPRQVTHQAEKPTHSPASAERRRRRVCSPATVESN